MRNFITSVFLLSFCFNYTSANAQDSAETSTSIIDLNFYFNVTGNNRAETNYSNGAKGSEIRMRAISGLISIYPIAYKKIQVGIGLGVENVGSQILDTLSITENRIPLLAVAKWNFSFFPRNTIFIKAQLGTAATLKSEYNFPSNSTFINEREEIGAPILANLGMGIAIPFNQTKVGLEFGYAFKQLGYKKESRYKTGAAYMGILVSLP